MEKFIEYLMSWSTGDFVGVAVAIVLAILILLLSVGGLVDNSNENPDEPETGPGEDTKKEGE